MSSERCEPKQYVETANESCHYCHNMTLQQVGNEKVCAHCGTRVYSTAGLSPIKTSSPAVRMSIGTR
jgi:uncharacterized paraquat-inducible protein A